MRNFFAYFLIALLSFGLVVNEAAAKRFGGGRSFGVQRSQSSLYSAPKPQNINPLGQTNKTNRWGGILGGLLVGGLLASLFMGHGLGAGLLSWLVVGGLAFFIFNLLRRKMQPGFQSAQPRGPSVFKQSSMNNQADYYGVGSSSSSSYASAPAYPAGFDPEVFLRDAKVKFIRLQAAYDQKNLQDLQEFTSPEAFAEIKMQFDERGDTPNKTEVITLNAKLLDVSKQADSTMASVRFTGSIKENDEPISELDEIWHFRQFYNNSNWVVAGVQQGVYEPR